MASKHPGNDYYVSPTGTIQRQSDPVLAFGLQAAGWSGPYDWTQAKATANDVPGRIAKGAAAAAAPANDAAQQAATSAGNAASSALGLSGLDALAKRLSEKNTWIRAAKILLGGAILLAGIAHITGAGGDIMQAARRIPA